MKNSDEQGIRFVLERVLPYAINKLIEDSVEFYKHFQGYASFKNFMLEDEKLNISNDLLDAMLVGVKTQEDLWGK